MTLFQRHYSNFPILKVPIVKVKLNMILIFVIFLVMFLKNNVED